MTTAIQMIFIGWLEEADDALPTTVVLNWQGRDEYIWERFKNVYELLNVRSLKFLTLYYIIIFLCMCKLFCVEFQIFPLKFHHISYPYIEGCTFYSQVTV